MTQKLTFIILKHKEPITYNKKECQETNYVQFSNRLGWGGVGVGEGEKNFENKEVGLKFSLFVL